MAENVFQFNGPGFTFSLSVPCLIHHLLGFSDVLPPFVLSHISAYEILELSWGSHGVGGSPVTPGFCPFARAGASPLSNMAPRK